MNHHPGANRRLLQPLQVREIADNRFSNSPRHAVVTHDGPSPAVQRPRGRAANAAGGARDKNFFVRHSKCNATPRPTACPSPPSPTSTKARLARERSRSDVSTPFLHQPSIRRIRDEACRTRPTQKQRLKRMKAPCSEAAVDRHWACAARSLQIPVSPKRRPRSKTLLHAFATSWRKTNGKMPPC